MERRSIVKLHWYSRVRYSVMMHHGHYVVNKLQCKSIWKFKILRNVISNLTFEYENFENHKFECNFEFYQQLNLSMVDMLYSGYLFQKPIISSHGQTLIFRTSLQRTPFYSGHLSESQLCSILKNLKIINSIATRLKSSNKEHRVKK